MRQARRPINKNRPRQKEWVSVSIGDICLWEFRAQEACLIAEYSTRPQEDPRGGTDTTEGSLWTIALACYDGDGPQAKRVWSDREVHEIRDLPAGDWAALLEAINRLHGKDPTAEEITRDFTPAAGAVSGSPSNSGVSATSTASPVS
jgi:hypothetical protein